MFFADVGVGVGVGFRNHCTSRWFDGVSHPQPVCISLYLYYSMHGNRC